MKAKLLCGIAAALLVIGCASTSAPSSKSKKPERNFNATSLSVDQNSVAAEVLDAIPAESMMDRFDMLDRTGRSIVYVALTDTDIGALVFIDQRLHGTLTHAQAKAFYSCRGHASGAQNHWASQALAWLDGLLTSTIPADKVLLEFSGKSTRQSIKDITTNSFLSRVRSFFGMGSNPLSVINTLNSAHSEFEASENYEAAAAAMKLLKPGTTEQQLAKIARPEDLAIQTAGMVLSYPSHFVEYFLVNGQVTVIQKPPFLTLAKTRPALFYAPGANWTQCTPEGWKNAVPEEENTKQ